MILTVIITLIVFLALGVPVAFALGLSGLTAIILEGDIPLYMVVHQMVRGINSFPLMACPMFILAGTIMGSAKLSDRIIDFCRTVVSWMRGGLGCVAVLANMIFAGISGSGSATISAIGSLTTPELKKQGYHRSFIAGIMAGSGVLGPVIPPSTNMILYGALTGVSIGKMFAGGIVPGILIGLGLMGMCVWYSKKYNVDTGAGKFSLRTCGKSFVHSFFALITPVIIIGGVLGGVFTATEAGIVACVYGLFCGLVIYRTIKLRDLPGIFVKAVNSSAMVLLIIATSTIYSYIFAVENVGPTLNNFLLSITTNPELLTILIVLLILVIGCFMETLAAMAVIVPILYPIISTLGIDAVQFGVIFCVATVIGGITPPVGTYLYLSMNIAGATFREAIRYTAPCVGIMCIVMLICLYVPQLITFLPSLMA